MKKTMKRILCAVMAVALIASFAGCAKINYVTKGTIQAINEVKSGEWKNTGDSNGNAANDVDTPAIDEFKAGTYGGINFGSVEDVVNFYKEAYDYSKTLMVDYKEADGSIKSYYKLLGEESLKVGNILIDGTSNSVINNLVPGIVDSLYQPGLNGLVPSTNRDPKLDTDAWDGNGESLVTSRLVADDILAANVTDNGDGTITLKLQPKAVNMSMPGADAQGHMFQTLGAIDAVVDSIGPLSWSTGTTSENCKVNYKNGVATVTINTASKEIVSADYTMLAYVTVSHANIAVIKDKSASLDITMKWTFPASAEYMQKTKNITLVG
ncbi:hypothetical protein [uncultured Eubacterium sp.]|uniref:hypothetical protein n=1 Tax=uncultured Eubacterium sp. TaxID=165185 RepID=UPI002804E294|nr:hypothetical protein [uncultured Eubacterium sp.]